MDWEDFYGRFRQPDFVPGYEIQNRLGGGAFGEVYKARKASIGKAYAVKFLKIDDDAQRDAALRELEQVRHFAAIDHPNLVTIEDLGTVMGVPYLIMGYAGEDTLARLQKRGRLEPAVALAYFVQTCRGVLALHDRRLVHFDLKPSNVFIKGDVARVGDYGLSKMMIDGRITLSFGRGTPQYMAPEMLRNRADHRADIYSLGVMLYECLAGRAPFESAVPGALHVRDDDTLPEFPPGFPTRARAAVERCLRLDPAQRYASVAELIAELGHSATDSSSAPAPSHPNAQPQPNTTARATAGSSDARTTAKELTRGAVEVARGVWDGLRTAGESSTAPQRARPPSTASTPPQSASSAAASAQDTPSPRLQQALAEGRAARAAAPASSTHTDAPRALEERAQELAADLRAASGGSRGALAGAGTIPVPPAAEGGVWQGLAAALALSFEVLFALVRGARRGVADGWTRAARPAQPGSRFFGGVLRLVRLFVFALVLVFLGVLVSYAFFFLIRVRSL